MGEQHIIDAVKWGYYAGDWPQAVRALCKRLAELEATFIAEQEAFTKRSDAIDKAARREGAEQLRDWILKNQKQFFNDACIDKALGDGYQLP